MPATVNPAGALIEATSMRPSGPTRPGIALFTARARTIHDLVSGLVVVRSEAMEALTEARRFWNMGHGTFPSQPGSRQPGPRQSGP